MKRIFGLIILMIATFGVARSQSDTTQVDQNKKQKKYKVKKYIKAADKMLKKGNLYSATDLYEDILKNKPEEVATAYKLAQSYYLARDYKQAEKWYLKVTEMDPATYPQAYYWAALMMKMNGKYEESKKAFEDFKKSYNGEERVLKKWAQIEAEGCDLALKMKADPLSVNITHLNSNVNSAYSDISPLMWNDTTLVFASLPSDTVIVINNQRVANDHYVKLYSAPVHDDNYSQAKVFDKFNVQGYHIANGAFSPDRKRFYFTKCEENRKAKIVCSIYCSEYKDSTWQEPVDLGYNINNPAFTSTHPSIAPYRKGAEILYFTSDRDGGKGGLDIWYSIFSIRRGTYSDPRNAGSKINTDRDEATPFYDAATGTLYFSSNGNVGLGGYDIFSAKGSRSRWDDIQNIGYPINSSTDDMYFTVNEDGASGYFVSNRPGIISIRSETCCDDIFSYEFVRTIYVAVKGNVYDEEDEDKTPIKDALVGLSLRSKEGVEGDVEIAEDVTGDQKPYFFNLNPEEDYKVTASARGYLTGWANFNTKDLKESDTLQVDIYLKQLVKNKAYRLKNIYYDFDKWDLREASKKTLDTLYNMLVENPTIIIELSSHTDSRGAESYNLNLSQKRAESCVNYLIAKGIRKDRLIAKGYGESRLLEDCSQHADCPDDNKSDCPCHQLNRRTEFKVIGELDADVIYEDERFDEGD